MPSATASIATATSIGSELLDEDAGVINSQLGASASGRRTATPPRRHMVAGSCPGATARHSRCATVTRPRPVMAL